MKRLALGLAIVIELIVSRLAIAAPITVDPQGDTFVGSTARHDIALLDSEVDVDSILLRISFVDPVSPPSALASDSVIGFIDIDLDQNAATGATSKKSQFSPAGPTDLGTEFYVNLASERFTPAAAQVVNAVTNLPVGAAEVIFSERQVEVVVPRSLFGGDALLNYGVIVGGFIDVSDEAPNFGQGVASTIPEPGASKIILSGLATAYVSFRGRRSRAA